MQPERLDDARRATSSEILPRSLPEPSRNPASSTVIVLGAGGYLGGEIARRFAGRPGCHVIGVFHRQPRDAACDEIVVRDAFSDDLRDLVPAEGRVVLVNAAFDFGAVGREAPVGRYETFEATLLAISTRPDGTCINLSTMSAFPGCRSDYGREKLLVEALFAKHRGINIRPGLVVSWQRPGTAFLRLLDIVRTWPFVPVLTSTNDGFFICDLDLLLAGIDGLVGMRVNKSHTLSFCYASRIRLADLLRLIASRTRTPRLLLPTPWWLVHWAVLATERIAGKTKIRADSIVDFAFPAVEAPRRHLYARLARLSRGAATPDNGPDFRSLEPPRRGRRAGRTVG